MWIHFTAANVEGKAVHICKYRPKTFVKNATKMQQQHRTKHPKLLSASELSAYDETKRFLFVYETVLYK